MSYHSSIRVFVKFKDDGIVFAGEDVECTITFKNVEPTRETPAKHGGAQRDYINEKTQVILEQLRAARARVHSDQGNRLLKLISAESFSEGKTRERPTRRRSSFTVVESDEKLGHRNSSAGFVIADTNSSRKHSRSVSIRSLGSPIQSTRPPHRHERSSSAQGYTTRGPGIRRLSTGAKTPTTTTTPSSPSLLSGATTPTAAPGFMLERKRTTSPNRALATKSPKPAKASSTKSSPNISRNTSKVSLTYDTPPDNLPVVAQTVAQPVPSPRLPDTPPINSQNGYSNSFAESSRTYSAQTNEEAHRESSDFYAHSDKSDETLVSELPSRPLRRSSRRSTFVRVPSQLGPGPPPQSRTETLMMAYAHVAGSFILDESLVNQTPFEELKRKGVIGGQAGGGVVGVARPHNGGSLFSGLSWGNIGESIGGLLSSGQPSSFKEMKGLADSKSVPLLSTPKSILFVDLKLEPGESKSFSYIFRMPRGLPASHPGRAMKVSYNITVVVQRPSTGKGQPQQIKQVEIPFRVFSGVNNLGESLDHDLMSPYIILRDQARILAIENTSTPSRATFNTNSKSESSADFQAYVNHLLSQPQKNSPQGLLSPTADLESPNHSNPNTRFYIPATTAPSTRALVDHAIRQITTPSSAVYSPGRFTIARASVPIATLMLSRPALKLGDLLTCVLDFSEAQLPCYTLDATLESSERVDPSLAIRSAQSIERASRRVWGHTTESCIWAQRTTIAFQVPVSATPSFGTTGVSLEWYLRLEFIVGKEGSEASLTQKSMNSAAARFSENRERAAMGTAVFADVKGVEPAYLLNVMSSDDRGAIFTARRKIPCESFEVAIPLRVFGAAIGSGENEPSMEGLPI